MDGDGGLGLVPFPLLGGLFGTALCLGVECITPCRTGGGGVW